MKFSVNWLREFVELPANAEELADLLTMAGIEIEAIESRGANFDKVVVAQIQQSKQHPNADRLTVCVVDDGSGRARQIVCGAKNYQVGDKVPLALPGAELSGGLKIRESKLRGVDSEGMLCSAKELGIAEDAAGLLILSPEARIGAPIGEIFPTDTIFDVEITPNRGDLLSHFGLAREIAALTGKDIVTDTVPKAEVLPLQTEEGSKITISAQRECPFYSARRIENVKVGPSPDWLRARIEALGIRAINNVVDISNYVMLELGQPTHAFDADKVCGEINVRLARDGEKFLALDGKTYSLTTRDLVIADQERVIGIGGVMGGEESGVTGATRNVLLESAYFLPASIRRTARTLNLPSDASYRFERGVDPQMILPASQRTAELTRQITGGTPGHSIGVAGELPSNPPSLSLRYKRCDELLGTHLESKTVDAILNGFGLQKNGGQGWKIPSYRRDLQGEVDLVEEVIRVHGIDKIPSANRSRFTPLSKADRIYDFETKLRRDLIALGLNEARTSSLLARDQIHDLDELIEVRNPLSEEHVALRVSLIPGLLAALARNVRAGAERIALFEIGNIFAPPKGEERRSLGIAMWGTTKANWRDHQKRRVDFFDLKGVIESLRVPELKFRRGERRGLVLTAEILLAKKRIGFCGQLSNTEAAMLDANGPVLVAEIDLLEIAQSRQRRRLFSGLERYPAVRRDIAMFVAPNVTHAEIVRVIDSANEPLLERIELFDLFTEKVGETAGENRKSLAYSLTYRDKNRTLTNEEVSAVHARIRDRLQREVRAELRE